MNKFILGVLLSIIFGGLCFYGGYRYKECPCDHQPASTTMIVSGDSIGVKLLTELDYHPFKAADKIVPGERFPTAAGKQVLKGSTIQGDSSTSPTHPAAVGDSQCVDQEICNTLRIYIDFNKDSTIRTTDSIFGWRWSQTAEIVKNDTTHYRTTTITTVETAPIVDNHKSKLSLSPFLFAQGTIDPKGVNGATNIGAGGGCSLDYLKHSYGVGYNVITKQYLALFTFHFK